MVVQEYVMLATSKKIYAFISNTGGSFEGILEARLDVIRDGLSH